MARKAVKPKLQFTIRLNKQPWVVRLYTKVNFERRWGNCTAITEYEHKTPDLAISFKGPRVSRDTIAHELFHAYCSYKDLTNLTAHTVEERHAELIGKKYRTLAALTDKIFNILTHPEAYTNLMARRPKNGI